MRELIEKQAAINSSAQPDVPDMNVGDIISRQAAIKEFSCCELTPDGGIDANCAIDLLNQLPSAQPEPQWIPFKTRPLTEEEKEDYPGWDSILDCKLPDDGQMILVSINLHGHERVQCDEFFVDGGCYLDSGYELGAEAIAWMPLPEPYRKEE